jgi:hypothetical protein
VEETDWACAATETASNRKSGIAARIIESGECQTAHSPLSIG